MSDDDIWTDKWDEGEDWPGGGAKAKRSPRGEKLGATGGEVVVFSVGPAGAHGFRNDGDETCRYLMASSRHREMPEVCEYPELGQITAQAPTASQTGERLWFIHDVPLDG
jgi:uncharacterized cupin superfamily protein